MLGGRKTLVEKTGNKREKKKGGGGVVGGGSAQEKNPSARLKKEREGRLPI